MSFEQAVNMAKLAEQCERYEDMVKHVKTMAKLASGPLDVDQRNLLSVAFKNVVGAFRASWRALTAYSGVSEVQSDKDLSDLVSAYRRNHVEAELRAVSADLLATVDSLLEKEEKTDESAPARVFYLKMKGDYYRYLAEVEPDDSESAAKANAAAAYEEASAACKSMLPTNPIRLGLALNVSVFYYEIKREPEKAISTAKEAFDAAIAKLDELNDTDYKDATLIIQLIRDNLTLWASDEDGA